MKKGSGLTQPGLRGRHLVCGDPAFYGIADPPELLQVWDYYGSTDDSV